MGSVSSINSLLASSGTSSSTSTSSSVNISSLLAAATGATSTGIDVTSAVAAAVYAAQAPERQWQAQQATLKSQITTLTSIQTSLASVSADLDSLNNLDGPLTSATVISSSPSVVTATAGAGAVNGNHTLSVSSLATSASWYSPAVASSSASLGSTNLVITKNDGSQTSFAVGSGTNSLTDLASAINGKGISVNASVVNDSSGSRLALVSSSSGSSADFTINYQSASGPSWSSASVASSATPLTASSMTVGDGTSQATIAVTTGETLSQLATQINSKGLNLSASVVTDAAGAHLVVAVNGANNVLVSNDPAFTFTRASQGSDASLKVDGIPVSSASNTVTGAVTGVTFNLLGTTTGNPVSLSISPDVTQITHSVSQFVSDYNSALSLVNSQFTFDSTTSGQGVLGADATVRLLQSMLMQVVSYKGAGSSTGTGTTLAGLGITMGNDGSLTLNSAKLTQAVSNDASAVQNFFQGASLNGFAHSFQTQLQQFTSPSTGSLAVDMKSLNQEYTDLQKHVNDYESGYIASQRTVLTAMYSQAEIALQQLPTKLKQLQAQLGNPTGG
jgi:flagellar hook-associated protein 2